MLQPNIHSGPTFSGLRIGLLGGSFNPAHEGHLAMSLYALKNLGLDQIWWLVSPQNPLKSAKNMAPLATRLAKARQIVGRNRIVVTDMETQFGTRYTAYTLRTLKKRFPHTNFIWLMGADNLRQISRWHRWQDIFRLVPVAVFRRSPYAAGRRTSKAAQRFDYAWRPATYGKNLAKTKPPVWLVLNNPRSHISATQIRTTLKG